MEIENTYNTNNITKEITAPYLLSLPAKTYCLVPSHWREVFVLNLPKKIPDQDNLYKVVKQAVQMQLPNSKVYIMSISLVSESPKSNQVNFSYQVIFLQIPKELINKLESAHMCNINFYVGTFTSQEAKILDRAPTLEMISTKDEYENCLPFCIGAHLS